MESEASDRDQTAYACSAQNPKMLPKRKTMFTDSKEAMKEKIKATTAPYFQGYKK